MFYSKQINALNKKNTNPKLLRKVSLAGQQSHDVPVTREYTELHQVSEHTENLQQELLQEIV